MFTADGPILKLLFYEEKNVLITVTESLILTQHAILPEGDAKEILKVKKYWYMCLTFLEKKLPVLKKLGFNRAMKR